MRRLLPIAILAAAPAFADSELECAAVSGNQVETATCLEEMEVNAERVLATAVSIASASASEVDEMTGREATLPALEAAQSAWAASTEANCAFVGAMMGGGSGTGIRIRACRIAAIRARIDWLLANSY